MKRPASFRSPEEFAQHPLLGLVMFLVGGLIFGVLAYELVTHGPLLAWDVPVANGLHTLALHGPRWVDVMIGGWYVGHELIMGIGLVLTIYFLRKRSWRELTMVVSGFAGSGILFRLLSHLFDRHRPVFEAQVWRVETLPGFPSGHAIGVVASYGLLAYFIVPRIASWLGKAMVIAGALLIVLYVGFSRLFIGDHFLTDIVAGYALGIAWSGLAYTVIELCFRKKSRATAEPQPLLEGMPVEQVLHRG